MLPEEVRGSGEARMAGKSGRVSPLQELREGGVRKKNSLFGGVPAGLASPPPAKLQIQQCRRKGGWDRTLDQPTLENWRDKVSGFRFREPGR